MYNEDTIAAIATPFGTGGIGIIRISGSEALALAARVFRPYTPLDWSQVRGFRAHYGHIVADGQTMDEGIMLVMRAPRSYTCEDVVELLLHGGMLVLQLCLQLCLQAGARLAERGEFTERAFLNGRIDLTQAEAVDDIITAKSEVGLGVAVGQLTGKLSRWVEATGAAVTELVASLEAVIDYPEEDLAELTPAEIDTKLTAIISELEAMIDRAAAGKVWKEGLKTVIAGLPNAGKSSLLNQLLAEERAIVTDIPGTTRDTITESALIHGIPLVLVDTAGIREASDQIEQMGIARTHRELAQADLILAVLDASQPLTAETRAWLATLQNKAAILLLNKTDLPLQADLAEVETLTGGIPQVAIAARTGTGMDELGNALATYVEEHQLQAGADSVLLTNVRQEDLARRALDALRSAQQGLHEGLMEDLITEDLRAAWDALGAIVGRNPEASITDEIFRRFCVGK